MSDDFIMSPEGIDQRESSVISWTLTDGLLVEGSETVLNRPMKMAEFSKNVNGALSSFV
jgi:hypothetical protein